MEENSFTIHLPSNVAPNTFPNNSPTGFTTPLSDDINLSSGEWEVGITNIMNPAKILSTASSDSINFHKKIKYDADMDESCPPDFDGYCKPYIEKFEFPQDLILHKVERKMLRAKRSVGKKEKEAKTKKEKEEPKKKIADPELIAKALNSSKLAKNGKFKVEYKKEKRKMFIHILTDGGALCLRKDFALYLGFNKSVFVGKASFSANCYFMGTVQIVKQCNRVETLRYYSLNRLSRSTIMVDSSYINEGDNLPGAESKYYISLAHKNEAGNTFATTNYYFGPQLVTIIHENTMKTNDRVELISVDSWLAEDLGFPNDMCVAADDPEQKRTKIERKNLYGWDRPVDRLYWKIKRDFNMKPFPFTYFMNKTRKSSFYEDKAVDMLHFEDDIFDNAADFLPALNKKGEEYGYEFTLKEHPLRFQVKSTGDYVLQLSPQLADVLGFSFPHASKLNYVCKQVATANFPPFVHRGIDTIFVYTDIVNSVTVGDIKAPLLLIYPFKASEQGRNFHQEFINPTYVTLNRSCIRSIEILLRDSAGEPIPFARGKTAVSLHFRKKNVM